MVVLMLLPPPGHRVHRDSLQPSTQVTHLRGSTNPPTVIMDPTAHMLPTAHIEQMDPVIIAGPNACAYANGLTVAPTYFNTGVHTHSLSVHALPFFPAVSADDTLTCLGSYSPIKEITNHNPTCASDERNRDTHTHRLIIAVIKCRSLCNKLPLISLYIVSYNCDILFLTEAWFNTSVSNSFLTT